MGIENRAPEEAVFYRDVEEEEFDLSQSEMDTSIRDMANFTIKAATDAGVYASRDVECCYDLFDKISEKDEEEEEEPNISSGGPGNDTSFKKPKPKVVVPKLNFDFFQTNEPLRLRQDSKADEGTPNSSLDSVDKLWQQALNMDDDDQNMFLDEEEEVPEEPQQEEPAEMEMAIDIPDDHQAEEE
jgi:hypothetical protein